VWHSFETAVWLHRHLKAALDMSTALGDLLSKVLHEEKLVPIQDDVSFRFGVVTYKDFGDAGQVCVRARRGLFPGALR